MKKSKLKRRLLKHIQVISQHLDSFLRTREQDQLHQLRLQIKKLKSLLILFASNRKNKNLMKIYKPIKGIFHHAGIIRDADLHQQIADKFGVKNSTFHKQQAGMMLAQIIAFCEAGPEYLKEIDRVGKKLGAKLKRVDVRNIANFYGKELDAVVLILAKQEFNNEMHECRKRVKNLLYNQKLFKKSLGSGFKLNITYLNKVQESLGDWHDSVLARDLFSNQLPGEHKAIDQLNLRVSEQEKVIIRLTANFWKKVTDGSSAEKQT